MQAGAFSRLQLAAALLEYDNDLENPNAPFRSANDSAIFAQLRQPEYISNRPGPNQYDEYVPRARRQSTDYLSVKLPSEKDALESAAERDRVDSMATRRSVVPHPAVRDEDVRQAELDPEAEAEDSPKEEEVDLASWGLGDLVEKKKDQKKDKPRKSGGSDRQRTQSTSGSLLDRQSQRPPSTIGGRSYMASDLPYDEDSFPSRRRAGTGTGRRPSLGAQSLHLGVLKTGVPEIDKRIHTATARPQDLTFRRRSIGGELDFSSSEFATVASFRDLSAQRTRPKSIAGIYATVPPIAGEEGTTTPLAAGLDDPGPGGVPFPSSMSPVEDLPNPFDIPLPAAERLSRFDPKVADHVRRMSTVSMGSQTMLAAASHLRTTSNASMGSRMMLTEADRMSMMTGTNVGGGQGGTRGERDPRFLSRIELMRPKVLVMPSPLQSVDIPPIVDESRDGFELSTGRPLPPGSKTMLRPGARPLSSANSLSMSAIPTSNSFTPNPRVNLTLSQLTFRNSLMVGGERDITYVDIDRGLKRAYEEGEQVEPDWIEEEQEQEGEDDESQMQDPMAPPARPAGRLYGTSLMDTLEARKAQLKGKQRTFVGDSRPTMMQRGQLRRDQAFIDPSTLPTQRPGMSRGNTNLSVPLQNANTQTKSGNRLSKTPLLNFDAPPQGGGMAETRSVFGVDQIWERELEKLKVIQEQERVAGEKRVKEEANKPGKRGKGKKKNSVPTAEPVQQSSSQPAATSRLSTLPPTLPDVKTGLSDIPVTHSDSDEEEEELIPIEKRRESQMTIGAKGWFADSSDDDHPSFGGDGPPRRPSSKAQTRRNTRGASTSEPLPPIQSGVNDGSDEDVPLAAQLSKTPLRAVARPRPRPQADNDDDDDRPLTVLMDSRKSAAGMSSFNLDSGAIGSSRVLGQSSSKKPTGDDDDDEVPLGLRIKPSNNDDEDDKPLGMRFSTAPSMGNLDWQRQQQQQQQFQLMQQQQFMMQQMHNPMTPFAPSMMGPFMPPFGVAPAQSLYMGMPMQPPIATPESSTFGRVERWRHNIGDE